MDEHKANTVGGGGQDGVWYLCDRQSGIMAFVVFQVVDNT